MRGRRRGERVLRERLIYHEGWRGRVLR